MTEVKSSETSVIFIVFPAEKAEQPSFSKKPVFGYDVIFICQQRGNWRSEVKIFIAFILKCLSSNYFSLLRCSDRINEKDPIHKGLPDLRIRQKSGLPNSGTDTKADTCEALVSVSFQAMPDKIQWNCLKISR